MPRGASEHVFPGCGFEMLTDDHGVYTFFRDDGGEPVLYTLICQNALDDMENDITIGGTPT